MSAGPFPAKFPLGQVVATPGALLALQSTGQSPLPELFVTDGMPARNLSPQTRKNYRHDLLDLLAFLNDRGASNLSDISLRHLEAYQAEMDRRSYSASTRNRKTYSIKSLFHFLQRLGITNHDIAEKLIPPSVQKDEPRFLSEAEYQRLFGSVPISRAMRRLSRYSFRPAYVSQNWRSSNCTMWKSPSVSRQIRTTWVMSG